MKNLCKLLSLLFFFSLNQSIVIAQNSMPSREQRIYDLSLIWKEIQYNFVFAETLQKVNIDSLYLAYLPKVEQVTNLYEYYRVLNAFTANFNDAHTRISAIERPDVPPPLEVINFGEKVIVSNIAKSLSDKIPIGSEIIKVNNIPTVKFVKDSISPYIGAATSHWKFGKSVNEMFYGVPKTTVKVTVKTPDGKENEVKIGDRCGRGTFGEIYKGEYKGKDVAVVGGGDTAVTEAVFLSRICRKVYIIHRRDSFRASQAETDKLKTCDNIEPIMNAQVSELLGDKKVEGIVLSDTNSSRTLELNAVFVAVGAVPNSKLFKGLLNLDAQGYIITDEEMRTEIPGVFAAGDIRKKMLRQVLTAASDGAIAAHNAMLAVQSY